MRCARSESVASVEFVTASSPKLYPKTDWRRRVRRFSSKMKSFSVMVRATLVLQGSSCSGDRRASHATTDRPEDLMSHRRDYRRRFATTRRLCPSHHEAHRPRQFGKPGDHGRGRSSPLKQRRPPAARRDWFVMWTTRCLRWCAHDEEPALWRERFRSDHFHVCRLTLIRHCAARLLGSGAQS